MNKKEREYLTKLIKDLEELDEHEVMMFCLWSHEPATMNAHAGRHLLLQDIIKNLKELFPKPKIEDTDFY